MIGTSKIVATDATTVSPHASPTLGVVITTLDPLDRPLGAGAAPAGANGRPHPTVLDGDSVPDLTAGLVAEIAREDHLTQAAEAGGLDPVG